MSETSMAPLSAREEWRRHWPLVLASMAGISLTSVASYALGLFIDPLQQEFGWSRTQISSGMSVIAFLAVPLAPFVGALMDNWGPRRLALPGVALTGLAIAAFGLTNGSYTQWLGLWTFYAIVALAVKTTIWSAAVSGAFIAGRGLALAVTLSGTALAQTIAPLVAQWFIASFGWREAFVLMGISWGGTVLALVIPFFREAHHATKGKPAAPRLVHDGLTMKEAFRSRALILIGAAYTLSTLLAMATIIHKVPILTEIGISRSTAAQLAATSGVAGIIGKLATGWLYDRYDSRWIGAISLSLPSLAYFLLVDEIRTPAFIVISMLLFGYGSGAMMQAVVYLTGKYGGLANFGKIFGVMASLQAFTQGFGPPLGGWIYDTYGTYQPMIIGSVPVGVLTGFLLLWLGPYPRWKGT